MIWSTVTIGDYLVKTDLRDPTKRPRDRFLYVDVSGVDNQAFAIRLPTELLGADAPSRARKVIRERDVLFATVRPTLRRIALVDSALDDQICSTGFCVLRPGAKLDAGFLYYWLLTDDVLEHVAKIEKGVSYPAIRDSDVKAIRIPYPPLPEQRQIVAMLAAVQQAIEREERLIALTAELKKALMHKLFTEGTRGESLKQTEIGPVPESWRIARLADMLREPLRNGHSATETADPRGIRTLTLTAVTRADFSLANTKTTVAVADKVRNLWLRNGDIFIERANTLDYVGLASLYEGPEDFAIFPDLLVRVRLDEQQMRPKVLCEYLISPRCRTYFRMNAKGTAGNFPKIDQGIIENLRLPVPSPEDQADIEHVARTLDAKQATHTRLRADLEELFRTLLHQLMTAQMRVHDLDLSALKTAEQDPVGAV